MADKQAIEQALSQVISSIQQQLNEMQAANSEAWQTLEKIRSSDTSNFMGLLPALIRLQSASASLRTSVESILRILSSAGSGMRASEVAAAAAPQSVPPVPARGGTQLPVPPVPMPAPPFSGSPVPVPPPSPSPRVGPESDTPNLAASPAGEMTSAPAAPEAEVASVPSAEEVEISVPETTETAPSSVEAPTDGLDLNSLPDKLKKLHKKAARFSRVAVQEFLLYKKAEAEAGRQNKDLYRRFKEEIDKTKEQYDEKFKEIADHKVDYFYSELVKTLANNDASALEGYPH